MSKRFLCQIAAFTLFLFAGVSSALVAQPKKSLTFADMMKFRLIKAPVISNDGSWIAYSAQPDRGDGEALVVSLASKKRYSIARGSKPAFSNDARWVAAVVLPAAEDLAKTAGKKDKPQNGLAILNTANGAVEQFEKIEKYAFSEDSRWLAFKTFSRKDKKEKKRKNKAYLGSRIELLELGGDRRLSVPFGQFFGFDSTSHFLAVTVADTAFKNNGLFAVDLAVENLSLQPLVSGENVYVSNLAWNNQIALLAYLTAPLDDAGIPGGASLSSWNFEQNQPTTYVQDGAGPAGWRIPAKNYLEWTSDGQRLFFGFKPQHEIDVLQPEPEDTSKTKSFNPYDEDAILKKKEVDVWHWNDPRINPNQKKMWDKVKDRTYRAVYDLQEHRFVQLADESMPDAQVVQNATRTLGSSNVPYLKEITWSGWFADFYTVDLRQGTRQKVVSHLRGRAHMSPGGRFVAYYRDRNWHLYDCESGETRNLTSALDVPFFNEDHDYPYPVPGYGLAGWVKNDRAVLVYDKYDIWQFDTRTREAMCLTGREGRRKGYTFRIRRLDPKQKAFAAGEKLLLTAYHNRLKHTAFYSAAIGTVGVKPLVEEKKRLRFLAKAKNSDRLLYTRESYREFPDVWVAGPDFKSRRKVTDVNPQVKDFAWGTAELVEWRSADGIPLQGVLIRPGNYQRGKRYPVLVYFYRFFSQRLYEFNEVVVNHRPCFPFYASNGYAIFLPDIRFEVGRPGFSSAKCLVPGVQKLIDMGIADPDAIGLHGHSWSGYQTAFVITQTDIFKCAVAGAPVSNMTSAYDGIRWGTGLARQFQYEQTQSRIGGSLWEARDWYIDNSPVFFADRIHTPLLMMFGDKDDAVPWYQGIELYLAMRRLGKDCIFLQYRGEPHHLKKYANKLDYAMKMKQYFDYHLKGAEAPDWITKGVPYQGK